MSEKPSLKAKEIVQELLKKYGLNIAKSEINSKLYADKGIYFIRDGNYRWSLITGIHNSKVALSGIRKKLEKNKNTATKDIIKNWKLIRRFLLKR